MDARVDRKPLDGIKVLDFSHALAGPFTTMLLGDYGADVIKVEKPTWGDGSRQMGVPVEGFGAKQTDYFFGANRNKKSLAIDIRSPEGQDVARKLAAQSDIVIENFRPGVMDRLGLGFDDLLQLKSGLIYCSISGYGPDGDWSGRPANDVILQSLSGLMGMTGEAGGGPVKIGAAVCDLSAGLFALSAILAALHARDLHPEGQHTEISMLETSLNMMCNYIPSVTSLGKQIPRLGHAHAQIVPYQGFECRDGDFIMVGAFSRKFWINLCSAVGKPEWAEDPRFRSNATRLANKDLLLGQLSDIFKSKQRSEWEAILDAADVPCSPIYELHEIVRTPVVADKEIVKEIGSPEKKLGVVGFPVRSKAWGDDRFGTPAPGLGAHSREVLRERLGMDDGRIGELMARGIVDVPSEFATTED